MSKGVKPRLAVSFSFGETSAYMTWRILNDPALRDQFSDIAVVAANTSREREASLRFGQLCNEHLGFNTVLVEAVQHHGRRKGAGHRVTSFAEAIRDGSVFEDMIRKYGVPNPQYIHCTRELKSNPIKSYIENELGWKKGTYKIAIGIRSDEWDRMSEKAMSEGAIYPLIKLGITKPDINQWWARQAFRLELKGYQGNCQGCFKKSFRKLLTLVAEDPSEFEWNRRMEAEYGLVGGEFNKEPGPGQEPLPEGYRRVFYRENKSVDDLLHLHAQTWGTFEPAEDDSRVLPQPNLFPVELDVGGSCGESCEPFADRDENA